MALRLLGRAGAPVTVPGARHRQQLPVERVVARPDHRLPPGQWPRTVAAVEQLLDDGLQLGPLTVLVGENGSGKSTLVEALAQAYGLSPEGGSTGAQHTTRPTESPLYRALQLHRGVGASRWGFFLRAETMHGFYTFLEANGSGPWVNGRPPDGEDGARLHSLSHGESFLEVLESRFEGPGLYVLDEPESALSFTGQLALVGLLASMVERGDQQAIVATHSPLIAATPGADIHEIGEDGITRRDWDGLELVQNWRAFLDDPQLYLRHLAG